MKVSKLNYIAPDPIEDTPRAWVGYLFNQTAQRIRSATAAALGPVGLSPPQLRALEVIAAEQPLNQVRLGAMVDMDRSTIVHLIDYFERLKLAVRKPDPADRRSHAIMLTEAGHHLLLDARLRARAVEDEFLAPLSPAERERLRTSLLKLFDPLPCPKENESEPSPPPPHS